MKQNRALRLGVQIIFFLLAPQAFSMAFSAVRAIAVSLGAGDAVALTSFVLLFVALCGFTIVFGRFFCGYACAFGFLGDVVWAASLRIRRAMGKRGAWIKLSERAENRLRLLKYGVLALLFVASLLGASTVISAVSPWTAFGRLRSLNPMAAGVVSVLLLVAAIIGMALRERFFCEFLCPLGAIFSLLPILPWSNMRRDMGACMACGACRRACPVGIYPPAEGRQMGECIQCGRCVEVCPKGCVSRRGPRRLVLVIACALILLVLLWAVGAVELLPQAPWLAGTAS